MFCQKQVSRAGTNNYIPQILLEVITRPCPWYLLLAQHSSIVSYYDKSCWRCVSFSSMIVTYDLTDKQITGKWWHTIIICQWIINLAVPKTSKECNHDIWEVVLGVNTVQCHYNAVSFLHKIHNKHPIPRPLGRDMGCLLWLQVLINVLPRSLHWWMYYRV